MKRTHVAKGAKPIVVEPREQDVRPGHKPKGFWYEVNGDWRRWCETDMPEYIEGGFLHTVTLGRERVRRIKGVHDFDLFDAKYGAREWAPGYSERYGPMSLGIRWADVAEDWDGVEIAPYLWNRRLGGPSWYYTWDCASGVIWRPDGITVTYSEPIRSVTRSVTADWSGVGQSG